MNPFSMKFYMRPFLFLSILLLIGCSQEAQTDADPQIPKEFQELDNLTVYPADSEPLYDISMSEVATYGSTNEVLIGRMGAKRIGDTFIFITDYPQKTIHVYRPDGSYVKSIGRAGRGPGEFLDISNLLIHNNRLYVHDSHHKRFQIFSLEDLEYTTSFDVQIENRGAIDELNNAIASFVPISIYDDGSFLVLFESIRNPIWQPEGDMDGARYYFVLNKEGTKLLDKVHEQTYTYLLSDDTNVRPVPFDSKPLATISENGGLVTANSNDFLLKFFDAEGNYQYAFYHPVSKRKLSLEQARNIITADFSDNRDRMNEYLRSLNSIDLPPAWPALQHITMDEQNRLWVATIIDDDSFYQWWILNKKGKLLARFEWPVNERFFEADKEYVYTIVEKGNGETVLKKYKYLLEQAEPGTS